MPGRHIGEWRIAPSILLPRNYVEVFTPQGKSPQYPLGRRQGGPQSWSGHGVEQKNSQTLPGIKP